MLLGRKEEVASSGEKKKERNEENKKAKKIKLRVATLNVETMTGKGREVADLMERRGVDILCVQEIYHSVTSMSKVLKFRLKTTIT